MSEASSIGDDHAARVVTKEATSGLLTGTRRATGLPAFANVTSSPEATRSNRRDRCVLASWTLTVLFLRTRV
jgi:hypothetical protein